MNYGVSVLGSSFTTGLTSAGAGVAATLPFTGPAVQIIQVLTAGLLFISLGVMLLRAGRLKTGERHTRAPRFSR